MWRAAHGLLSGLRGRAARSCTGIAQEGQGKVHGKGLRIVFRVSAFWSEPARHGSVGGCLRWTVPSQLRRLQRGLYPPPRRASQARKEEMLVAEVQCHLPILQDKRRVECYVLDSHAAYHAPAMPPIPSRTAQSASLANPLLEW